MNNEGVSHTDERLLTDRDRSHCARVGVADATSYGKPIGHYIINICIVVS